MSQTAVLEVLVVPFVQSQHVPTHLVVQRPNAPGMLDDLLDWHRGFLPPEVTATVVDGEPDRAEIFEKSLECFVIACGCFDTNAVCVRPVEWTDLFAPPCL